MRDPPKEEVQSKVSDGDIKNGPDEARQKKILASCLDCIMQYGATAIMAGLLWIGILRISWLT